MPYDYRRRLRVIILRSAMLCYYADDARVDIAAPAIC